MVTLVEKSTILVFTVKLALVEPAGTVTLEGTLATPLLLLERLTCAPPEGAGPLKVTVPVEDPTSGPPITLEGFNVSEANIGSGGGVTVREAVWLTPPKDAEMVTEVDAATALVVTVNVVEVAPAGTTTLGGTCAVAESLLESATCAPPAGAAALKVTVPVEGCEPPSTVAGFNVNDERETVGGVVELGACSKSQTEGFGSLVGSTTNFEGEIP